MNRLTTIYQKAATAVLRCGCVRIFDPPIRRRSAVMCPRHGPTIVIHPDVDWIYTCPSCTGGKSMTRRYGQDEVRAREAAQDHADRYGHTVKIIYSGKVVSTCDSNM